MKKESAEEASWHPYIYSTSAHLLPSTFGPGGNVLPMRGLQCGSHVLDTVGSIWLQQTHCRSQLSPSAKHTYEKAKRSSVAVREECEKQLCRHQSERRRGRSCSRGQSGGSPGHHAGAVIHTATHRGPHTGLDISWRKL